MHIVIEACVASASSARAALAGGADRLELNRDLERDGLTPRDDVFREVRRLAGVPIIVMIRPHDRGYDYDAGTVDRMCEAIGRFAEAGAEGFAVGALDSEGRVHRVGLARLRDAAGSGALVFHRAFDEVREQGPALDALIDAGVTRVLTSGGRRTAAEGAVRIAELVERAAGRIEILPGAGVNPDNVARILDLTGCTQIHGTFRDPTAPGGGTDEDTVRRVRRAVDSANGSASVGGRPRSAAGILRRDTKPTHERTEEG